MSLGTGETTPATYKHILPDTLRKCNRSKKYFTTQPGVRNLKRRSVRHAKGSHLWKNRTNELCPSRGDPEHAESSGDPEEFVQVVPRRGPARCVQGCGRHHRLLRQPRAALRGLFHGREPKVHRGRVQSARCHVCGPAEGQRPPAQQGNRGDQGAGDLHGRFPDHDAQRHLRHQRRGACHRLADRAFPRRVLR